MIDNDFTLLDEMKESWGQSFEELNNAQRLWMLQSVGLNLFNADPESTLDSDHDDEIASVIERLDELNKYEILSLLEALVNQIKFHRYD
jgi:hypothetical protein